MVKVKLFDLDLGDGRIRKVRLDLGALEDAEEASGYNYLAKGILNLSAKALRVLVWASVKWEDENLEPDDLRELIHAGNWSDIYAVMYQAYTQGVKTKDESEGNAKAPVKKPARKKKSARA